MAGDWIKMRTMLDTDPAVFQIAAVLNLDELGVVGRLWKVWSWADSHSVNGNAVCVTGVTLDRLTATPGFTSAMREVGWLEGEDHALTFPNFARHNGQTAKQRALTAERVTKYRNGKPATSVTDEALLEKRREDKGLSVSPRPTLEEVIHAGIMAGVPKEVCEMFFLAAEERAMTPDDQWTLPDGKPMTAWRVSLKKYFVHYENNKQQRLLAKKPVFGATSSAPSVWTLKQQIEAAEVEMGRIRGNPENKEQIPGSWDRRLKAEAAAKMKELKANIDAWRRQMTGQKEAA